MYLFIVNQRKHNHSTQGLYIRFRDLSGSSQKFNIMTVMSPAVESHVVSNLKKFTKYEFFIAPFYRSVEGQPSNTKNVQTLEDGKCVDGGVCVMLCGVRTTTARRDDEGI